MNAHRVCTLAALAALCAAPAAAQVPLTPRALGLGNGYVAAARGAESLWQNPANLGLPGTSHWSFNIPTVAVGADILGLSVNDVRDVINYDDQSDARKEEILDDIPAGGTDVRAEVRVPLVAAQIRHFAVGLSYTTLGNHTLQKDFVDLLLFGFQPLQRGIPSINLQQTQGFRASYVDVAAAYGRRLPIVALPGALTAGATVHWYHGSGVTRTAIVDVDTIRNGIGVPTDIQVTYAGVSDKGGGGFGVDLGAAYQPMPNLTLSASVSNVINSFDFGGDRRVKSVTLTSADYDNGDLQAALDRYDASETAYVAGTSTRIDALATDLGQDTELPSTLRLGAALEPRAGTLLSAGYTDNLKASRTGGLWEQSLGVGVQQRLAFLQARVGVASNLDSGTLLSGGLSLGPLHFGVARINDGSVEGFDRGGWVATFGLGTASQSRMP
ncbi:MAG TPA: DUF5723 family protein [Longimicrobium sp.]|nr:DUF5723 family protein [Longimicrobium sp.]